MCHLRPLRLFPLPGIDTDQFAREPVSDAARSVSKTRCELALQRRSANGFYAGCKMWKVTLAGIAHQDWRAA
jgi:hypothetical protein